jgi:hypothetical protein
MNVLRQQATRQRLFVAAIYISALALSATTSQAQRGGSAERVMRERNAELLREMEIKRREGAINAPRAETPPVAARCERCKEDFRRLQLTNNEMMRTIFSDKLSDSIDYQHVSKATTEIKKRASRLKSELHLPEPERAEERPEIKGISNDAQLKASLLALDKLIIGFVTNPIFRSLGTLDTRQGIKVRQDLVRIIELSQSIKLSAEKMEKSRD